MAEARTDTSVNVPVINTSGTVKLEPWDENHEDGQKSVANDKALLTILINNMGLLTSEIVLSDDFWDLLLQRRVIDEKLKSILQASNLHELQVHDLVGHLMRGKMHQVHGFFWVLVNTKQHSIVELLGFPAKHYFDVELLLKSSCISCPSCSAVFSNKAYIMVECGHYVCRPCIKGAYFSVGHDKTENIKCPVPDCGEVTKTLLNMEDRIGLESDEVFMNIVGDLMKDCSKDKTCHLCSCKLNLSFRKHFCTGCKKFLCGACISKHEGKDHQIIHKHTADVCCLHGKKTEAFCSTCNIFRCESKEENPCKHQINSGELEDNNTSLQYTYNQVEEIGAQAEEFGKLEEVLEDRTVEMVEYIEQYHDDVKRVIDQWADDNLSCISRMTRHVRVKHKQSLQWKALSSELIDIQKHQPWVDLPLDKLDLTLPFEVEAFVSKIRDGEPPSSILSGLPYLPAPVPAPTKAKYMAEWQIPPGGYYPTVAWTPDGQLLVTSYTGLHLVNYNTATSTCTATLIHAATRPSQVTTAEDGSWVMAMGDEGILVINDAKKGEVGDWSPPGIQAYSACIDNSCIYVRGNDSPTVYVYSRDLVEQRQYQLDPNYKKGMIHFAQTGEMLQGLWRSNAVLVMNPKTGKSRSFQNKGANGKLVHPYGMSTVGGGEYILASEAGCVSVFTYQGEYLHDLQIEDGAGSASCVSVLERQGEPTLLAHATYVNLEPYVKLYTLS